MSIESLKRVLTSIKGQARGMKKDRYEARIAPNPPPVAMPPTDGTEEEVQEAPEEAAAEEAAGPDSADTTLDAIQALLDKAKKTGASNEGED